MRYRTLLILISLTFALLYSACGGGEDPRQDPFEGHIFIGERAEVHPQCLDGATLCSALVPNIHITPEHLAYERREGQVKGTLTIANTGSGNLRIDSIEIEGDEDALQLEAASPWTDRVLQNLTAKPPSEVYMGPASSLKLEFWWDGSADLSRTALLLRTNDPDRVEVRVPLTAIVMPEPENNQTTPEPEPEPVVEIPCHDVLAVATIRGSEAPPSDEIETSPLETLEFSVISETLDVEDIERYEWTILERPPSSTARLTPSSSASNPRMFIDLNGAYTIEAELLLKDGEVCAKPRVDVYVAPCDC